MTQKQARILVTGGNGYLGSVLVPFFLQRGYRVRVLDRFSQLNPTLISCVEYEGFEAVKGDVRDRDTLRTCIKDTDFIIPLAGIVGAPACNQNAADVWSVNYHAVVILAYFARDYGIKLLYPNTNSAYGKTPPGQVTNEDSKLNPLSSYAKSKQEAEVVVLNLLGENAISFRLATAFGPSPRMRLDLLVNDFVYRALRDKSVVLYESLFRRNFIHVHDIARLFHFGVENFALLKGKAWNAGLHYSLTKRELCDAIQQKIPEFQYFLAETGQDPDQRDYSVSTAKLEAAGFKCSVSLERGIRELIKTYSMFPVERFRNA